MCPLGRRVPGDFLFHFTKAIQFVEVGIDDDTSLSVNDSGDAPAVVGVASRFPQLLDQEEFFGGDKRQADVFLKLEQAFQQFPPTFHDEWARTFVAIHAPAVAPAFVGVAEFHERFAEFDEVFHAFVACGKQAFAGFVAFDDGAGQQPNREWPQAGYWCLFDGAFAVGGVAVKLVERAVVAAHGLGFCSRYAQTSSVLRNSIGLET